jgi:hypothetical protein
MAKYNEETLSWEGEPSPEPKQVFNEDTGLWETVAEWDEMNKCWINPPEEDEEEVPEGYGECPDCHKILKIKQDGYLYSHECIE